MNPFLLTPDERLADWKALRRSLASLPEIVQLEKVADYWAKAPLRSIAYAEDVADLPGPWEMIHAGQWCRNSVAIGMEATLRLAGWSPDRLVLRHILDPEASCMLVVLQIDRRWALNYEYGQLTPYPATKHRVMQQWQWRSRAYSQIGD